MPSLLKGAFFGERGIGAISRVKVLSREGRSSG